MPALIAALGVIATWVLDLVNKIPGIKFVIVLGIMLLVIAAIPWPAWMSGIGGLFAGLPPGVLWALELFKIGEGLTIIASAWALRFLLRWVRAALAAS